MTANLKPHPLALEFPEIVGEELEQMEIDIKEQGVLAPVWLYEGKVLEGWHRYKIASKVGKSIRTLDYKGKDAIGFVISMNIMRRHLERPQRATVLARLLTENNRWAKIGTNQNRVPPLGGPEKVTIREAAAISTTSETTIERAKKVVDAGRPLAKAVEAGELSLRNAEQVAPRVKAAKTETQKKAIVERHVAASKAKERPKPPKTSEPPKSFSFTSEIKWLLDYLRAWRAVLVQDASVALRQGKFSPEAAAFFARELRKTFEPIAEEFEIWATRHGKIKK